MMMPMKIAPALLSVALLLSGCAPAATPTTLKQTCEAVQAAMKDAGGSADQAAMARLLVKVQAIHGAGDATSREALAPVIAAGQKAIGGGEDEVAELFKAYVPFMAQCVTAGAVLGSASPSPSPSPSATAEATPADGECRMVAAGVVDSILADTGRTAVESASARSGKGPWLIALKLRSGDVGVWLADSTTDPSSVQSVNVLAGQISDWSMASPGDYDPARVAIATACVGG